MNSYYLDDYLEAAMMFVKSKEASIYELLRLLQRIPNKLFKICLAKKYDIVSAPKIKFQMDSQAPGRNLLIVVPILALCKPTDATAVNSRPQQTTDNCQIYFENI